MLRWIHKIVGLFVILPLMVLAISGSILSLLPAADRMGTISARGISVASLAGRVASTHAGVEEIKRLPSGKVVAFYSGRDGPAASVVDPVTGASVSDYAPSGFERWITNLHRSFFLGDGGRIAAGAGAFAMLVLALSGLQMTARRMGGWRHVFGRARGNGTQRLHVEAGRLASFGLLASTLTALYLSFTLFGVLPDGVSQSLAVPPVTIEGSALPVERITALRGVALSELRELTFPNQTIPNDLFHLTTASGEGYIDPASGQITAWQHHSVARQIYEFVYKLHTGRGLWWLGLLLGVSALGVPALGLSGVAIWWSRRRTRAPINRNVSLKQADAIILVGSEGGSTWGFARTLHAALTAKGHGVHAAPMASLSHSYPAARRMFVLTSTYGDGAAPASARAFLELLDDIAEAPSFPVAVIGFGDRQFPQFCGFARDVEAALVRKGWKFLMGRGEINRQSEQEFSRWGDALSAAMGEKLTLTHVQEHPRTHVLTLTDRTDYGAEVQAPTAVLRFAVPRRSVFAGISGRGWPRFAAGDLLAVVPPDSTLPRYYSLASSSGEGFIEICVRKHPGGRCSGFLHGLRLGESIEAFVRPNPAFHPARGNKPVILVGAGTGIGPLAGHVRANVQRRPMYLYFGGRDPASDFLYGQEISDWLDDERLTGARTAFSRVKGGYVQDRLRDDAEPLRTLVAKGAQIMVCGGRSMAAGVLQTMTDVLSPLGLTPAALKSQGRYVEDAY